MCMRAQFTHCDARVKMLTYRFVATSIDQHNIILIVTQFISHVALVYRVSQNYTAYRAAFIKPKHSLKLEQCMS